MSERNTHVLGCDDGCMHVPLFAQPASQDHEPDSDLTLVERDDFL